MSEELESSSVAENASASNVEETVSAVASNVEANASAEKESESALSGLKEKGLENQGNSVDLSTFSDDDYLKAAGESGEEGAELAKEFTKEFRDAGVSPEAANKIIKGYIAKTQEAQAEYQQQMAEESARAFEGYTDADKQAVGDALTRYVPKNSRLMDALMHSPLGNDRDMLALLRQLGKSMARDKVVGAGSIGANGANVPLTTQLGF